MVLAISRNILKRYSARKKPSEGDSADHIISTLFGINAKKTSPAPRPAASTPSSNFHVSAGSIVRGELESSALSIAHIDPPADAKIPQLTNGLDRVLFNPGVHTIRDLRTNVYNFDPFLQKIVQPSEFNFDCLPPFIPPYKDTNLRQLASEKGAKFVSSTSSISTSLGIIYFVVSNMRQLSLMNLSSAFAEENRNFTLLTRSPTSVILRPHENGIRSIVTEKIESEMNVLSYLGQSLERLLTMEKDEFKRLLKDHPSPPKIEDLDGYAHTIAGDILIRSQLDCQDPRLPRRSFDLKTRATLPIRMDVANYQSHLKYHLTHSHGLYGSFEREFYDMCRSALLKYNFQVRIGNMDGIFVAYHNTAEIFGFQYLSREAMDECLFGNSVTGDAAFLLITRLYNEILSAVVPTFNPDETIRLTFSMSKTGSRLAIFAESIRMPEGKGLAPNASHFRQYTLTTHSTINGVRSDDILLHPHGGDSWKLFYTLSEVKADMAEFTAARAKATELLRGSSSTASDSGSFGRESFSRGIQETIRNQSMPACNKDPIIASWTIPSE